MGSNYIYNSTIKEPCNLAEDYYRCEVVIGARKLDNQQKGAI